MKFSPGQAVKVRALPDIPETIHGETGVILAQKPGNVCPCCDRLSENLVCFESGTAWIDDDSIEAIKTN